MKRVPCCFGAVVLVLVLTVVPFGAGLIYEARAVDDSIGYFLPSVHYCGDYCNPENAFCIPAPGTSDWTNDVYCSVDEMRVSRDTGNEADENSVPIYGLDGFDDLNYRMFWRYNDGGGDGYFMNHAKEPRPHVRI